MKHKTQRKKHRQFTKKRMSGGKSGKIQRYINLGESYPLGAGNFGVVVATNDITTKLFYDMQSCEAMKTEARIQEKARLLLKDIVSVPKIHDIFNIPISYREKQHLCGLTMDRVPIPEGFNIQKHGVVHILLGYDQADLNTTWSKDFINPISEENPPRGFHLGPEMLEDILEDEGVQLTIEDIAYKMGLCVSRLLKNGIIPLDMEWIYGGNGELYLIDFGLCEEGYIDKLRFFENKSSQGLYSSYYYPKPGWRGYKEFFEGYWTD